MDPDLTLSQLANEAFDASVPPYARPPRPAGPASFRGLVEAGRAGGSGSGRGSDGGVVRGSGGGPGALFSVRSPLFRSSRGPSGDASPSRVDVRENSEREEEAWAEARSCRRASKLFQDPIYGAILMDPSATDVIDSRGFQRLRRLKQLGCSCYVFPGASHNRFEHSIGVGHLAQRMCGHLWNLQGDELGVDRRDLRNVHLAGLCHDLGHGPFSHVFDRGFLRARGIANWSHEEMSARMLEMIVDESCSEDISRDDLRAIEDLILSGHPEPHASAAAGGGDSAGEGAATAGGGDSRASGDSRSVGFADGGDDDGAGAFWSAAPGSGAFLRSAAPSPASGPSASPSSFASLRRPRSRAGWMSEVVANGRNGVDVDKFDYLLRDSTHCGVKLGCDPLRLIQFSRVIEDEICYRAGEYLGVQQIFEGRAHMHRTVYTHKKGTAVDLMVVDALVEADQALKLTDRIWSAREFCLLDDSVLEWIENRELFSRFLNLGEPEQAEADAALRRADAVIARLRRRDLYAYAGERLVPSSLLSAGLWRPPSEADLVSAYRGTGPRPRPEDVVVRQHTVSFSMEDRNPLDHVHFYDRLDAASGKRALRPEEVSNMMPAANRDAIVRVYSKRSDPASVRAVHEAFQEWVRTTLGGPLTSLSPVKAKGRNRHGTRSAHGDVVLIAPGGGGGGTQTSAQSPLAHEGEATQLSQTGGRGENGDDDDDDDDEGERRRAKRAKPLFDRDDL